LRRRRPAPYEHRRRGRPAREVSRGVPPEARPGYRIPHGVFEFWILGLPRVPVMTMVAAAIGTKLIGTDRIRAEPARHAVVDAGVREESPVGGVVHQHEETDLPATDDDGGHHECQR